MLLRVIHETVYEYAPSVSNAQHMAHLRPLDVPGQRLLEHHLRIEPPPAQCLERTDVFGNTRAFFSLPFAHESLRVRAESLVETSTPFAAAEREDAGKPLELEEGVDADDLALVLPPSPAWEEVRDLLRYRRGAAYEPAAEFAFASPHIPRHADFVAYAEPSFAPGRPLLEAAWELMSRIHADFTYAPAETDVGTPALEALSMRRGVCQDFAHIMIACLRGLGLAARYVSGYLLTQPPPGQPRLVGSDASHAWVAVWVPGDGDGAQAGGIWHDLDPTNDRAPGEDYVTLAVGRDYADVSPLRGVIHGGARHILRVAVTVAPADEVLVESPRPHQDL
jgi:transglutaminase-like putative cysteine protease